MRDEVMTWPEDRRAVAELGVDARATFITRTYTHLFFAILLFIGIEVALFQTALPAAMYDLVAGAPYTWLLFLGGFMLVGWLASAAAMKAETKPAQYAALIGFVTAEAVIFIPLLYMADQFAEGTIQSAALVTLGAFAALTMIVFVTKKDFSFLRSFLMYGSILLLGLIVYGALSGGLGIWFPILMVAFAGAAVLYNTSNVLHHYPEDRYVAASLSLFASIALMFWYILQLFMASDG